MIGSDVTTRSEPTHGTPTLEGHCDRPGRDRQAAAGAPGHLLGRADRPGVLLGRHPRPAGLLGLRAGPLAPHLRRHKLPSPGRLSRRLRSPSVVALLAALARRVVAPAGPGLFWAIDGKPLVVGGCSKDRQ